MKLSTVVALATVGSASAFVAQAPTALIPRSRLGMAPSNYLDNLYGGGKKDEPSPAPQSDSTKAMEARLAATQKSLESRLAGLEKGKGSSAMTTRGAYSNQVAKIWDQTKVIKVQGGSLRTWSYPSPAVEKVQVVLKTEGRPLDADVELWQGPDNTPVKMRVYVEDGSLRPFSTVIDTPRGPNTISIRNIGQIEFPLDAAVSAENVDDTNLMSAGMTIQGGALRTYPFDPSVESVAILLTTDGRPLNARIELLQGPNNNKQVIELYTEDGLDRPFFGVIAAPGSGNVVRIVNTAPVEFPLTAKVEPYEINTSYSATEPVLGGDATTRF